MEDSFFGFDTSLPLDDDGSGQIEEPSEEEYDALNDETFGSAINGDWEEAHESLVRLTDDKSGDDLLDSVSNSEKRSANYFHGFGKGGLKRFDSLADADLDLNLSGMKLDDVDINFDDSESTVGGMGGVRVDSSVWGANTSLPQSLIASHHNTSGILKNPPAAPGLEINPANFLRQNFPNPFQHQQQQQQHHLIGEQNGIGRSQSAFGSPLPQNRPAAPKICTLEDIERNMIIQQAMQKQQHHQQQQQQQQQQQLQPKAPTPIQLQKQQPPPKGRPPGFGGLTQNRPSNNFANNMAQHPLGNLLQPPAGNGNRLPPGMSIPMPNALPGHAPLPPHPILNQHGLPLNYPYPVPQHPLPNPHLPVALNNFAMHPNFSAMRAAAVGIHPALAQQPQGPRIPPSPGNPPPGINPQTNSMFNMFNMRLVQEIQQNHPMLQNMPRQQQMPGGQQGPLPNQQGRNMGNVKQTGQRTANGNLPNEVDEYANLMSTRDKHWLISIQLSQLNTDTPYIDDYYYTMYKEKRATLAGTSRQSQAHKDNQLNHPLTQPKGHAQLILVQLGNKNGTRNGQHRERRSSEASTNISNNLNLLEQRHPYVFAPLRFENSLGKLQYGSVTAPRKIIDAEIMSSDMSNTENTENNTTTNHVVQSKSAVLNVALGTSVSGNVISDVTMLSQRKSRHILLHIETLYRIVLKLEDLDNPNAISTILIKIKKENERLAVLEQLENSNKTPEERAQHQSSEGTNTQVRKFNYEIETKEALLDKLVAGLALEKVIAMMNVRKGKILIRRILPLVSKHAIRWQIWIGVFSSLQSVVKKDREDTDGVLYALYDEFKSHIKDASFQMIVKLCKSMPTNDKKSNSLFCSKFVIASLVCLIIHAEAIFVEGKDSTLSDSNKEEWRQFLDDVATSLNKTIQNQTICAAIESDSLLALITEAKQQIK